MSRRNRLAILPLALSLCVLLGLSRPAAAQYTLTLLPANFSVISFNNNGQFLGYIGSSLYLITNGVSQFVSAISFNRYGNISYLPYLNRKGQIAGVDNNGNLFLYFNGNMQIIEGNIPTSFAIVGLTGSSELVWNEYVQTAQGYTTRIYQNNVLKDIGSPSQYGASYVNNAGQILSGNSLFTNGAWKTPPHLSNARFLNNNGQILTYATQTIITGGIFYNYSVNIGIYDIATDSVSTIYNDSYNQYLGPPYVIAFNDEGDFAGVKLYPGASSSPQSTAFCYIKGQLQEFGYINSTPSFPSVGYTRSIALNNQGQTLYETNGYLYLYDPITNTTSNSPISYSVFGGNFINDRGQIASGTILATPNALQPADSVSGQISFEGEVVNAPAQNVTFEFRDAVSNQTLFMQAASVASYGGFTLSGIPAGSYNVRVKSPKNLAQVVSVVKTAAALSGVSVFLAAGDANNDNSVDTGDFNILVGAFGSVYDPNTSNTLTGYDIRADFNGDGMVDISDFNLFVVGFGNTGDL